MTMHFLGLAGHPRRYFDTTAVEFLKALQPVHVFISIAAFITIGAQFIFLYNFFASLLAGKEAKEENPWHATTLEWSISSPPPFDNFGGVEPVVYHGPYEFSVPGAADDYIPQHLAPDLVRKA
jgi:cytochrome c oxidase subunit I